jgi:hypothetical protein
VEQINTKQRAFELIKDSSNGLYVLKICNWRLKKQPLSPKSYTKPLFTLDSHHLLNKKQLNESISSRSNTKPEFREKKRYPTIQEAHA